MQSCARSLIAPCEPHCLQLVDRVRFLLLYPAPRLRASPPLRTLFFGRRRRLSAPPTTSLRRSSRTAPRRCPGRRAPLEPFASSVSHATQNRREGAACAPRWSRRPCRRHWNWNLNPYSRLRPADDAGPIQAAKLAARAPNRCRRRAPPPARHSACAAKRAREHLLALGFSPPNLGAECQPASAASLGLLPVVVRRR